MIKHGSLKYQFYGEDGEEVLFDLEKHPEEDRNLIREPRYKESLGKFRKRAAEIGFSD